MQRLSILSGLFVVVLLILVMPVSSGAEEVPHQFNYQGFLRDSAADPVTGLVNFQFFIYPDSIGGSPCWGPEVFFNVEVVGGFFELQLGSKIPIDTSCFDGSPKWLEIWVNGAPSAPRKPINSVAYAFASSIGRINGSGTQGFLPRFADSTTVEDSQIFDDGANVGIGTPSPSYRLDVNGDVNATTYHGDGSNLTGILRVYDSGWFHVSIDSSVTLTHNLGTSRLMISVFFNTSASDQGAQLVMPVEHRSEYLSGNLIAFYGLRIDDSNTITIRAGNEQVALTMDFPTGEPDGHSSGYYKVVILALD